MSGIQNGQLYDMDIKTAKQGYRAKLHVQRFKGFPFTVLIFRPWNWLRKLMSQFSRPGKKARLAVSRFSFLLQISAQGIITTRWVSQYKAKGQFWILKPILMHNFYNRDKKLATSFQAVVFCADLIFMSSEKSEQQQFSLWKIKVAKTGKVDAARFSSGGKGQKMYPHTKNAKEKREMLPATKNSNDKTHPVYSSRNIYRTPPKCNIHFSYL